MRCEKLALYTAEQTSQLDHLAIENAGGISTGYGYSLMKKAGASAFHIIMSMWPETKKLIVFCGTGNNGGDGYVVATLASARGMDVQVYQLGDLSTQKGDALTARTALETQGVSVINYTGQDLFSVINDQTIIVDALLGIGITRDVKGLWKEIIEFINQLSVNVAAIDVPSGLNVDTGTILGEAVSADITITFIGRKPGLYTNYGSDKAGEIKFDSLHIPLSVYQKIAPKSWLLPSVISHEILKPRHRNSHKGRHGKVLAVGGNKGMSGAILLSSKAALRTGCGSVTVLTHSQHADFLNINCPEIMCQGINTEQNNESLVSLFSKFLKQTDVLMIGPGLGVDEWANDIFFPLIEQAKEAKIPVVIDADGLNHLSRIEEKALHNLRLIESEGNAKMVNAWILTPHPGEAATLLQCNIIDIQNDRCAAAKRISKKYNAVCVLKGAGTVISDVNSDDGKNDNVFICASGNPGMSVAGMGDVLTGVVGTFAAQKEKGLLSEMSLVDVVNQAVMLHAMAGDEVAAINGEKGMLASDLFPAIQHLINDKK